LVFFALLIGCLDPTGKNIMPQIADSTNFFFI
jgi:hypothetical protein